MTTMIEQLGGLLERPPFSLPVPVPPEARLREDLGMDSLLLVELILLIESELGIELADGDLTPDRLHSVGSLGDLLTERAAG